MIGRSRKIKPQEKQRHRNHQKNETDFENRWDWESSDSETISSFSFALRKVIKSEITRNLDQSEIHIIEKRFDDTSRVIYKELEQFNRSLLLRSYRRPLKSDIVAIEGLRLTSPVSTTLVENKKSNNESRKVRQASSTKVVVPTIESVWDAQETPAKVQPPVISQEKPTKMSRTVKNTVSPEIQNNSQPSSRKRGICRVT